uniref:Uncharacterized protein n=1 Tax=Physcomitrium patens TaxID=3218 RepID=A0A2K1IDA6_PHYPA|nr:hypothetical protein PHYPA_029413 [Physcomitrium patens]
MVGPNKQTETRIVSESNSDVVVQIRKASLWQKLGLWLLHMRRFSGHRNPLNNEYGLLLLKIMQVPRDFFTLHLVWMLSATQIALSSINKKKKKKKLLWNWGSAEIACRVFR